LNMSNVSLSKNSIDDVRIYPNPTHGKIDMRFSSSIDQADIRVYDMTGKLIQEFEVNNSPQFTFFLKGENGIYTIEMITDKGEFYRKRISKID